MKVLANEEKLVEIFDEKKIIVIGKAMVFNSHLLHPRMLDIFEHALGGERDNDLVAIFVSETGPMDRYAEYCKHTKSMVISLPYIMDRAFQTVDEKDVGLSLTAGVWINMIHVFLHELHHNVAFAVDWAATEANLEGEEEDAQEYADIMLEKIIAKFSAEVPPLAEIPWFNTRVMEFLIDEIREGEKDWASKHKRMIDENLIFDNGEMKYTSIREYFKDSTEMPGLYSETIEKVPVTMVEEKEEVNTNLFDAKILPGEQMKLLEMPVEEPASEAIIDVTPEPLPETKEVSMTAEEQEILDMTEQLGENAEVGEVIDINPFAGASEMQPEKKPAPATSPIFNPFGGEVKPVTTETPATAPETTTGKLEMLRGIYMRLHEHMFAVCGFSAGAFLEPTNILKNGVPLTEDERKSGMIIGSFTLNAAGQGIWEDVAKTGGIRGRLFKNGALPGFDLMINWNGKVRKVRLLAQNPNKGSEFAMRARAGEKISWLIDDTLGFVARIDSGGYALCAR